MSTQTENQQTDKQQTDKQQTDKQQPTPFHTPNSEILSRHLPAVGTRVDLRAATADATSITADTAADTDTDAAAADTATTTAAALVVAVIDGDDGMELIVPPLLADHATSVLESLELVGASASLEKVTRIPAPAGVAAESIVAVGLGDSDPDAENIRRASGAAGRALGGVKPASASTGTTPETHVITALGLLDAEAAAEGFALGAYSYKGLKGSEAASQSHIVLHVLGATEANISRSAAIADAVCTARDLVNAPSSHLFPESFAGVAVELGASAGLSCSVLDDAALNHHGFGGLTAVGGGSERGPRLVRMEWAGAAGTDSASPATDSASPATVALVGKGVTFDTGGISLKPGAKMEDMISDMGGAAAVIATVVLAARLNLPTPVTATIPMAENMPDGKSYRPGDVITQYGGKTIEILNTDAEGRLILADAIVRACEDNPTHVIDTATLTGAQLVALGSRTPGVLGTDDFRDRVAELSRQVGENGWSMPMPEELTEALSSPVADLRNVTNSREGGMSVAAAYLREFVTDGINWVHIDVAGPAFNTSSAWGYTPQRGTGVPVRTMLAVIEDLA